MIVGASPELYRLTERDRNTLLVEPFFGRRVLALAIGDSSQALDIDIPADRICLCQSLQMTAAPEAATTWRLMQFSWRPTGAAVADQNTICERRASAAGAIVHGLVADSVQTPVLDPIGLGGTWNLIERHLMLPPGGHLRVTTLRSGTTVAANVTVTFLCYLIPSGNVGRVS